MKGVFSKADRIRIVERVDSDSSENSDCEKAPEAYGPADHKYTNNRRRILLRRFGWYASFALIGGTVVILGCLAFLTFLWAGRESHGTWTRIVLSGWVSRSITMTAVVLRTVITIQAAVATAMLAGLYLDTFETTLPNAAAVSLTRYSNTGPLSFLWVIIRGKMVGYKGKVGDLGGLLFLITATTTLLQFVSTALLSDVAVGTVARYKSLQNVAYGISPSDTTGRGLRKSTYQPSYMTMRPASYPAFAEYSEPWNATQEGISDTGFSMRAFLPVQSANDRNALTMYSGMATLVDTRVVCVRPVLRNLKFEWDTFSHMMEPTLSGYVLPSVRPSSFNGTAERFFNCTLPDVANANPSTRDLDEWQVVMCSLNENPGQHDLISAMRPIDDGWIGHKLSSYMLINSTGLRINTSKPIIKDQRNLWAELPANDTERGQLPGLRITLCYTNNEVQDTSIEAQRSFPIVSEPTAGWTNQTQKFELGSIRKQLGATRNKYSTQERGIFSLAPKHSWVGPSYSVGNPDTDRGPRHYRVMHSKSTDPSWMTSTIDSLSQLVVDPVTRYTNMITTVLCRFNANRGPVYQGQTIQTISPVLAALFNEILRDTQDPAVALQAFLTCLLSMTYYDQLFQFDQMAPANIISAVPVIRTTGWKFFSIVIGLVGLHLFLIFFITYIFINNHGATLLDNAWSAVAQLQSPECQYWLENAGNMTDDEVKQSIRFEGRLEDTVGVSRATKDYPRLTRRTTMEVPGSGKQYLPR